MKNDVTGIILAAGESKRLGKPKQLLKINDEYLINEVVKNSSQSNLSSIVIVLGAFYNEIQPEINLNNKIKVVQNLNWSDGQSTSLKCGLQYAEKINSKAAMFLLGDQPFVNSKIINKMLEMYEEKRSSIVMMETDKKRTPPIIFPCEYFKYIHRLEGDTGAKEIIKSFEVRYFKNTDDMAVVDVDTLEEYNNIKYSHSHNINN